jgi:hypothetical protein
MPQESGTMKKLTCFVFIVIICITNIYSQATNDEPTALWKMNFTAEAGYQYPKGSVRESIAIRQNISSYFVNQSTNGQISSGTTGAVLGLKYELFNTRFNSGLSTGLRLIRYESEISGYSSSTADFFYLRYSEEGADTKFARIKSLNEINSMITIPVELKFVLFQNYLFDLFCSGGVEASIFNIKKDASIKFQDESMKSYETQILNNISEPSRKFCSTLYASAGISIGKENRPNLLFEVFPAVFLTKNNFTFTEINSYSGFKFSMMIPIN